MMHWNYRLFFEEGIYTIRTVYYKESGAIAACSEKESAPFGEFLAELQEELNLFQEALKQPVISASDLPSNKSDRPQLKRSKSLQAVRQQRGLRSEIAKGN